MEFSYEEKRDFPNLVRRLQAMERDGMLGCQAVIISEQKQINEEKT